MTSKLSKVISKFTTKLIWLISILFILAVLLLSIIKISLPYWIKQKDSIVEILESSIGGQVDYASLQVDWSDFHPVITFNDLTWKLAEHSITLQSRENYLEVNVWKTLFYGELATNEIELEGIKLQIPKLKTNNSGTDFKDAFFKTADRINNLNHDFVSLKEVEIEYQSNSENKQYVPLVILKKDKNKKQLLIDTNGDYVKNGRIVIETKGAVFTNDGQVDYYLDLTGIDLELLASDFSIDKIEDYRTIDFELWAKQKNGVLQTSRLELSNNSTAKAKINLKANLFNENGLYQIISDEFVISLYEQEQWITYNSFINLKGRADSSEGYYHLSTGKLPVAFLKNMVAPLMDKEALTILKGVNPGGVIRSSSLKLSTQSGNKIPVDGELIIDNFSLQAYKNIPGIKLNQVKLSGLDGYWVIDGFAKNIELDWQPTMKSIIPIGELQFNAEYSSNLPSILNVHNFLFLNKDSKVKARAQLDFSDEFTMAIFAEAEDVDVGNLKSYWPRNGAFSEKTLEYLDSSLLAGTVPYAKFVWQGEVDAFPFKDKSGVFDIEAQVSQATFKFEEDWPVARDIYGTAFFSNEKMEILLNKGQLLGTKVLSAKAILPDLKAVNEQLFIDIVADTNWGSYQEIYNNSPLLELLGDDLLALKFDDTVNIKLHLDLLLAKDVELKLDGQAAFKGNTISGIPYGIELNDTKGNLKFTHNGAIAENIKSNYLGNEINLTVKVDEFTGDDSSLNIDASGNLSFAKASKSLVGFSPLQLHGVSDFKLHYKLYDDDVESESIIIRSDLVGTEIIGPSWVAKDLLQSAPLLVTVQKIDDRVQLRTSYKDSVSAQLAYNSDTKFSPTGLIKLGTLASKNIEAPEEGISIEGYFDKLVVSEWLDAFKFPDEALVTDSNWALPSWIKQINITTPYLEFADQGFTKVRVNSELSSSEERFRLNLFSEQAKGNINQKLDGQKQLKIEHLDIKLNLDNTKDESKVDLSLDAYDNWLFECENCKVNGYQFGPLSLRSNYQDEKILIRGQGSSGGHLIVGINGTIDPQSTNFDIFFDVKNPNELMKHWAIPGGVRETETSGQLNLNWPGRLHDFDLQKTDGLFQIKTGKGSIKDLSDRKARIFSLFSLQSIPRRLSLDFSDIFRDGFFYDEIIGNFKIEAGVLKTEKAEIKGTAADVEVKGSVDLNDQTVQQQVVVTPKLGSSLPVLAGWAIEPTTGLIMLIVSKIFEPALNVVSQIEYEISGPLDNPVVKELSKQSREVEVTEEQIEAEKRKEKEFLLEPQFDGEN